MAALLAGVALTVARSWPKPPKGDRVDEKPAIEASLTVQRFDVSHAERNGETARERGRMGLESFSTRLRDRATVAVTLSRPAHSYLIAYAPNGKEFLLDPYTLVVYN